jgi:transaldolase
LFSLSPYQAVVQAYLAGLETRARQGKPLAGITSVASFFLSRIDTLVDGALDELATGPMQAQVRKLRGRTAIASARMAYKIYKEIIASEQWQRLAAAGANTQRLLWASTSTKDPDYSDVKYVEALIGPGTIDTLPLDTIDAYRDHGEPMERLETDLDGAHKALAGLAELGIDLAKLTEQLEREGVQKFIDAYDKVLSILARRITATKGQQ